MAYTENWHKSRWSIETTGGGVKKGRYNFPFFKMATSSQIPMSAAARKPIIPIKDIPKIIGGVSEMTISAEPIISAAIIMENAIRLLIWSWAALRVSRPWCSAWDFSGS